MPRISEPEGQTNEAGRSPSRMADQLRRLAAGSTALMLVLSWSLWAGSPGAPRVPFFESLLGLPGRFDAVLAALLVVATAAAAITRRWRPWFALSLALLVWLILNDQHRFQPWAYQYALTCFFLAALPGERGLQLARWWFVALYAHSALSKLDVSFCNELGPVFLKAAFRPFGTDPWTWPNWLRILASLSLPAGELAVAVLLAIPAARWVGRIGAVAFHLVLIGILGPLGLNHSAIVLVWNAALASQNWVCFAKTHFSERTLAGTWYRWPMYAIVTIGMILPFGERSGIYDAWPAHALYASHVERVSVLLHESERERWQGAIGRHVQGDGEGPWVRLDLTGWSRELRGTPVYPQNRAALGLAQGLAARYGVRLMRVVAFGPADRWTGQRTRVEAIGSEAIRRLGQTDRLNAQPAPGR